MWTFKKKLYYVLYLVTAAWLPENRRFRWGGALREFWASRIISDFPNHANIEKFAKFGPELVIGEESAVGVRCEVYGPVSIGRDGMMGPDVVIYTRNHRHALGSKFGCQGSDIRPVHVGNNVWFGRRAMVMPGSIIGDNVVVAAGAVVAGKYPSNVIIGGNPAKVIKEL